jgi:hypothetical protein
MHTPFVDSSVLKKKHQRATLLASAVIFNSAALPSRPVHRWRAWLLFFGSFGAKSPSTIFLASWANTRQKNQLSFLGKKSWANTGVK